MNQLLSLVFMLSTSLGFSAAKNGMVYGESGRLDSFDPYTVHETSGQRLSDLLFDSLVEMAPGGEYVPALAESWAIEKGGTEVRFTLRKNVNWHDNRPFTANDVSTTVRVLTSKSSEFPNSERFSVIKGVEVIDDHTVKIVFNRSLLDPLRSSMFKVLPSRAFSGVSGINRKSKFAKQPYGTGPYKFKNANSQGEIILSANESYFKGAPKIKNIIMKNYSDQNIMAQSLMYQSLDMVTYVSPRDLGEISGDQRLSLVPYDALSFSFIALNTSKGILKDKRVRKAISYALNRQEMLDAFFQGKGRLISGPFPPTSWAYNVDVKPLEHNLKKAKALLTSAGLKDKNGDGYLEQQNGEPFKLLFAVPLAGESEMIKRIVLAFQGFLKKAGIKVELQFMDWLVWKNRVLDQHDYDVTIASWSFDDASNISSLFHSSSAKSWGNNFVMYQNPEVDSLLTEAESTNDFDKRRAIYKKLHSILADEAPYVYLWTLMNHAAHNTRVSGVRVEPFSFFKYVINWQVEK